MLEDIISVTDAARNFSDVINRIYYQQKSFLLTRGGTVVARLTPPREAATGALVATRWADRPRLDLDDAMRWEEDLLALKAEASPPEDRSWDS